jgi:hypothetical protein
MVNRVSAQLQQNQGQQQYTYMKCMINNDTIANFQLQLSQET